MIREAWEHMSAVLHLANSKNMGKTGKADAASSSEKTSDIQKTSEAKKVKCKLAKQ